MDWWPEGASVGTVGFINAKTGKRVWPSAEASGLGEETGGVLVCTLLPPSVFQCVSRSVVPDSLRPRGLQPTRLLCVYDSPGKDTGVGCHLLHGIFPTQGSNRGLRHGRQIVYPLSYEGSPVFAESETKPTKTASRPTTKAHKNPSVFLTLSK